MGYHYHVIVLCGVLSIAIQSVHARTVGEYDGGNGNVLTTKESIDVFDLLSTQIRGNFELIRTWVAEYEFVEKVRFSNTVPSPNSDGSNSAIHSDYWTTTRGVIAFEWDVSTDHLHVFYEPFRPPEHRLAGTGEKLNRKSRAIIYHWILTPEHWIEFRTNSTKGQLNGFPRVDSVPSTGGRIITRRARAQADRYSKVFDPRDLFSNGSHLFWKHCELYLDALRGKKSDKEKQHAEENVTLIQRTTDKGTLYDLTIKFRRNNAGNNDPTIVQTTFDSSVGFQPISWVRSVGGKIAAKRTFSYKEISGIYVPSRFEYADYETVAPGSMVPADSRIYVLKTSRLNETIPVDRFGIEQFELKYGERMLDEIENRLYVMDDTGLVPVEEFSIAPARIPTVHLEEPNTTIGERGWMLAVVNLLIIVVLVVIIALRRRAHA